MFSSIGNVLLCMRHTIILHHAVPQKKSQSIFKYFQISHLFLVTFSLFRNANVQLVMSTTVISTTVCAETPSRLPTSQSNKSLSSNHHPSRESSACSSVGEYALCSAQLGTRTEACYTTFSSLGRESDSKAKASDDRRARMEEREIQLKKLLIRGSMPIPSPSPENQKWGLGKLSWIWSSRSDEQDLSPPSSPMSFDSMSSSEDATPSSPSVDMYGRRASSISPELNESTVKFVWG